LRLGLSQAETEVSPGVPLIHIQTADIGGSRAGANAESVAFPAFRGCGVAVVSVGGIAEGIVGARRCNGVIHAGVSVLKGAAAAARGAGVAACAVFVRRAVCVGEAFPRRRTQKVCSGVRWRSKNPDCKSRCRCRRSRRSRDRRYRQARIPALPSEQRAPASQSASVLAGVGCRRCRLHL